jgi:hypothetical protein
LRGRFLFNRRTPGDNLCFSELARFDEGFFFGGQFLIGSFITRPELAANSLVATIFML